MKLLPKQEHAVYYLKDNVTTELVYGGAAGGGKSALGCLWGIELCQKYKGIRVLMGRSKLTTLKKTTLNTFFELASALKITDQFNYNAQSNIIYWNNGSEIILQDLFLYPSDPNFDSLGSLEVTAAFIDECNQISYKAWQVVKSRCRYRLKEFDIHGEKTIEMEVLERNSIGAPIKWLNSKGEETEGLIPKMLGSCNPSKGWVYKKSYLPNKTNSLPEDKKFIQALPKDNPHLPPSYIKSLLDLDEASKRRLHDGDWEYDDDKSTLISYNSIINYWNGQHVKPEGKKYLTIDVARKGKDCTVFRVWHGWVCIERLSIAITLINEVVDEAKRLQAKHGIRNTDTVADEDGVGGGVVDYLRCEGFVNNSRALNGENYDNLKSQCSVKIAKRIELGGVVEMCNDSDTIDRVSEEMEQIKLKDIDKDGKVAIIPKDKIKELIGRSPDDWDTIMMREIFELITTDFFIG